MTAHQGRKDIGAPTAEESSGSLIFSACWIAFSVPPRHSLNPLSGRCLGPGQFLFYPQLLQHPMNPCPCWYTCGHESAHVTCVRACSHVQLCNSVDHNPPGSSVRGILQQGYWSGLPYPPPGDLPHPAIKPAFLRSPVLAGRFFTILASREAHTLRFTSCPCFKSLQWPPVAFKIKSKPFAQAYESCTVCSLLYFSSHPCPGLPCSSHVWSTYLSKSVKVFPS